MFHRGLSQAFYRERLHETVLGFQGLEDFMQNYWEKWALSKRKSILRVKELKLTVRPDPENLLVMLQTWQNGDISKQVPYDGNFEKALASIRAKALVLPSKTDLYFPYVKRLYQIESY